MKYMIFLTLLMFQEVLAVRDVYFNNRGVKSIQENDYPMAYQNLLEAIGLNYNSEIIHFNIAFALEKNKEFDKAIVEYEKAVSLTSSNDLKYMAYFNKAKILGDQKKIDEALLYYQKSLDIRPDSVEAKTNIELLLKQQQGGGGGGQSGEPNKNSEPSNESQQDQKQNLNENDIQRIFEELERQEQKIRAKENNKEGKDSPEEKDW